MANGVRIQKVDLVLDKVLAGVPWPVLRAVRHGYHPWSVGKHSLGRVFDRVITTGKKSVAIYARSQTMQGSAQQKLYSYDRDCQLLNCEDFKAVIVVCGAGWRPELVNDLRSLGNTFLPQEVPSLVQNFLGGTNG